jgi:hypothetical protein
MAISSSALKRLLAQGALLASTDRQDGADRSKEIEPQNTQNTQNTQRAAVLLNWTKTMRSTIESAVDSARTCRMLQAMQLW